MIKAERVYAEAREMDSCLRANGGYQIELRRIKAKAKG
jgi:hypothetical protein